MRCSLILALISIHTQLAFPDECASTNSGLIGWWPGENDAADVIGGNDGALSGATFQPGQVGSGFALDGASYVQIPNAEALRLSADSPSTLDSWVYPTAWPSSQVVPLTATKPYYYGLLYFPDSNRLRANINDGDQWYYLDAAFSLPLSSWTHVAQTWDGQNLRIYANGALLGTGKVSGNVYPRLELPAFIGRWLVTEGDPQEFFFTGIMDEVGIQKTALDASSVKAIFQAGSAGRCEGPPPPPFRAEIVPVGRRCVALRLSNDLPVKGGEIGIAFDPAIASLRNVTAGPDFPAGGVIRFQANAPNGCVEGSGVSAGFTLGWLNSTDVEPLTPPGKHDLLKICFGLAEGAEVGSCSELKFVACLGPVAAPVRNIVTDGGSGSQQLASTDGSVCLLEELPFQRGDANSDGNFDISDPIGILGCLFLGSDCSGCPANQDANDDGHVDIADPTFLLNWRFLGGPAPPPPFPGCGQDPTEDDLDECESVASCGG